MSAQAGQILDQLETVLAAVAGMTSQRVLRGSPVAEGNQSPITPPAAYLWLASLVATRGPTSRTHGVTLRVGYAVFAAAAYDSPKSKENASLDLMTLLSAAVLGAPSIGGLAYDVDLEIDTNGTLPGSAPSNVPGCFVAGTLVVRYAVSGGAI